MRNKRGLESVPVSRGERECSTSRRGVAAEILCTMRDKWWDERMEINIPTRIDKQTDELSLHTGTEINN